MLRKPTKQFSERLSYAILAVMSLWDKNASLLANEIRPELIHSIPSSKLTAGVYAVGSITVCLKDLPQSSTIEPRWLSQWSRQIRAFFLQAWSF